MSVSALKKSGKKWGRAALLAAFFILSRAASAFAAPEPWGIGMQSGISPLRDRMDDFHNLLLYVIFGIVIFVLGLLVYVIFRFNARANPTPSNFAHNTPLEIVWTVIPIIILAVISVPSIQLLYFGDKLAKPDMTLKITGHQWYWSYEYPDHGNIAFDARPIWDSSATTSEQAAELLKDASPKWLIPTAEPLRMLETDNRLVLPVGVNIRLLFTGADVIHSWLVPSLGVQEAAIPGRLGERWVKADREGIYYGQCTLICGAGHGYMPIVIEAVSPERFAAWVKTKHDQADGGAGLEPGGIRLARMSK
ncbi:MAG: cytochrome c oxidase subunit II [Alphaproteobacteria bacterium]